jgi:GGDEF domain-containing protein
MPKGKDATKRGRSVGGLITAALPGRKSESAAREAVLRRAKPEAEAGRRLAIYERETGLLAYWYIALRGDEECYRAGRYGRPLALLLAEPAPGADEWDVASKICAWLTAEVRKSDVAGYLGNGRCVVLMPETSLDSARRFAARLARAVPGTQFGLAGHPLDGESYHELASNATKRLGFAMRNAA